MSTLVFIGIFLFCITFTSAILFLFFYKEKPIDKLKYYDRNISIKEKVENNKSNKDIRKVIRNISKLIPRINKRRAYKLELDLVKADIPLTVEELLITKILTSTILSFFIYSLSKDAILSMLIFFIVWSIPKFIIIKKKNKKIASFNEQINEAIMIISNSLKAGYSFLQALSVVTSETKDPLAKEFKKLLKEMRLGISMEDAFDNMLNRVESEDLKLIVNAILIQKDIGGNLSEILDNISETIRERQKIKNELNTLTAQGKLSGIIIMLIPVFLGLVIYLFNKEFIMLLFNTKIGLIMSITAVINEIIGFIFIRKIVNVEM